jgi:hydroxymethylpyrimidine/phosphomethylpyrimidine kinase
LDLLSIADPNGTQQQVFRAERQRSNSTHGTGCAFATAIACHLARGREYADAVRLAKDYVTDALANAYPLGRGIGPVNHLYAMPQDGTTIPDADKKK